MFMLTVLAWGCVCFVKALSVLLSGSVILTLLYFHMIFSLRKQADKWKQNVKLNYGASLPSTGL